MVQYNRHDGGLRRCWDGQTFAMPRCCLLLTHWYICIGTRHGPWQRLNLEKLDKIEGKRRGGGEEGERRAEASPHTALTAPPLVLVCTVVCTLQVTNSDGGLWSNW